MIHLLARTYTQWASLAQLVVKAAQQKSHKSEFVKKEQMHKSQQIWHTHYGQENKIRSHLQIRFGFEFVCNLGAHQQLSDNSKANVLFILAYFSPNMSHKQYRGPYSFSFFVLYSPAGSLKFDNKSNLRDDFNDYFSSLICGWLFL